MDYVYILATDKDPTDPTWIGAWWLGYLLCSIVLFIGLLPMFFYPKHIIDPSQRSLKAKKKYNPDESFLDQIKGILCENRNRI